MKTRKTPLWELVPLIICVLAGLMEAKTSPTLASSTFFGGSGNQRGTGISISTEALYLSGISESGWNAEGLVVSYALPSVLRLWSATWPGAYGHDAFYGLAVSDEGLYLAGDSYSQTVDGCGWREQKGVIVEYNAITGTPIWAAAHNFFPYRGYEEFKDVATDGSTFVYALGIGETYGWGPWAIVLAKYDFYGSLQKMVTEPGLTLGFYPCFKYQNVGQSSSQSVIVHNDNIYIGGASRLTGLGEDSVWRPFLSKFSPSLIRQWKKRPADVGAGSFVRLLGDGNAIYAAGFTYSEGPDSSDYFIQKYDEAGTLIWSRTWGGSDEDRLTGVAAIGGRLFAVGYTRSEGAGGADAVILEIDPAIGEVLTSTLYGGVQDDMANGVATDGQDLYVVGESRSFASGEGNMVGENDLMLLKYTLNRKPVAVCKDIEIPADENCQASITAEDVDGGAYDPDEGDSIELSVDNIGPFPLGEHFVNFTVTDEHGATDSRQAKITVLDTTPPEPDRTLLPDITGECSAKITSFPTATDNCTGTISGTTSDPLTYSEQGTYTETWTFDDGNGNTTTQMQTVIIKDTTLPVPDVPTLPTTTGQCSAEIISVPTATDNCTGKISGTTNDPLSYTEQGTYTVIWTYDDKNGNITSQTQTVVVRDTTPPNIENLIASPNVLWPPNHKMVSVTLNISVSDNCDTAPTSQIISVSSNEPENGLGDGDIAPDWKITGDLTVKLRAERSGAENGRVYTITVRCIDASGNNSTAVVTVKVPRDKKKK